MALNVTLRTHGTLIHVKNVRYIKIYNRPVGTHADVVHVELDGFRLLFVFEMVVRQQVVQLVNHRGCRGSSFWKCWHLGQREML